VVSDAWYVVTERKAPARRASASIGSARSRIYRVYSSSFPGFARQKKICASVAPSAGLVVALSAPVPRGVPPDDAQAMNTHANATIASPERCTSLSAVKVAATMVATPG
jgi:hypothetical protein